MKAVLLVLLLAGTLAIADEPPARAAPYLATIAATERAHDIPAGLLLNLIHHESNFDTDAVSPKGALGIAQIVPKWHPNVDPSDPAQAIAYAGRYLASLNAAFGSWTYALVAYNWGYGNMKKYGPYKAPRESLHLAVLVLHARI